MRELQDFTMFVDRKSRSTKYLAAKRGIGKKAIASHSTAGKFSTQAMSPSRPDESSMTHEERKRVVLPCGFTLAQSWAALRKSWQGYLAAKHEGNTDLMTKYAYNIRKFQIQMDIPQADFEVLDDDAIKRMEAEVKMLDIAMAEKLSDEAKIVTEHYGVKERHCDYDALHKEGMKEIDRQGPPPTEDLFHNYYDRKKGCYVVRNTPQEVMEFVSRDNSCAIKHKTPTKDKKRRVKRACFYKASTPSPLLAQ